MALPRLQIPPRRLLILPLILSLALSYLSHPSGSRISTEHWKRFVKEDAVESRQDDIEAALPEICMALDQLQSALERLVLSWELPPTEEDARPQAQDEPLLKRKQTASFEYALEKEIPTALRQSRPVTRDKMDMLPVPGRLTSGHGWRHSPLPGRARPAIHHGVDIAAPTGTPVSCIWPGIVTRSGWYGSYGLLVEVWHGKSIFSRYAHLSRIHVPRGKLLSSGDILGLVGSTGRSTGPHLHFEIRYRGQSVNPVRYILLQNLIRQKRK